MYTNPEVRIHSSIADLQAHAKKGVHGYSAVLLYFYCRWLDIRRNEKGKVVGDGKVMFNISEPAIALGKSVNTIKDYLVNGVDIGLFRSYSRKGNTVTVFYASLHSIAARHGLESLGVFAEIPIEELKHLKYWSTQLTAQHLQGASRHLAKKKLPKDEQVAQPEDLLQIPTYIKNHPKSKSPNAAKPIKKQDKVARSDEEQNQWVRNVVCRSDRYTFVDRHFIMFGVSQEHIADYQNRSLSTVHRRLNNNIRHWIGSEQKGTKRERGIEPLPYTQLARFIEGNVKKSVFEMRKALEVDLKQEFWAAGGVWQTGPNVYERQFAIRSGKSIKYWYQRKLETGKLKFGVDADQSTGVNQISDLSGTSRSMNLELDTALEEEILVKGYGIATLASP